MNRTAPLPDVMVQPALESARCPARLHASVDPGGMADESLVPLLSEPHEGLAGLVLDSRWHMQERVIEPVLQGFRSAGVRVWAYKGFDYAQTLYRRPGLRPMRDVDLLVPPEGLDEAAAIIDSLGWMEDPNPRALVTSGMTARITFHRGPFCIDLHTHPLYFPSTLPGRLPEGLFSGATGLRSGLLSLEPADSLTLALIHMLTHMQIKQIWWVDAALLCDRVAASGQWPAFSVNCSRAGLPASLGSCARILRDHLGCPVPEDLVRDLEARRDRGLAFGLLARGRGWPSVAAVLSAPGWRRPALAAALAVASLSRPGRGAGAGRSGRGGKGA